MCVVAIAWQAHPRWHLIIAANRDEYHERPTAPLARWPDDRHVVYAGRDLRAGGTWLGVGEGGRAALVTNLRVEGYPRPELASRGALVSGWLRGQPLPDISTMNPFNLLLIGPDAARLLTNHPEPQDIVLGGGVHGVSNGPAQAPWPRRERLEAAMHDWIAGSHEPDVLFATLADETALAGNEGDRPPVPVFMRDAVYGTRCSTVVALDGKGRGFIEERRFAASGMAAGATRIEI
jgi:uncharacterized protein with NRDE domain